MKEDPVIQELKSKGIIKVENDLYSEWLEEQPIITKTEIDELINLTQKLIYYLRKEKYGNSTCKKEGQKKQTTDPI